MNSELRTGRMSVWSRVLGIGVTFVIGCIWLGSGRVDGVMAQGGAPNAPTNTEAKKTASADVKPPELPATTATKTSDTKPPEPRLQVVESENQTIWDLVEGTSATVTLLVKTDAEGGINLAGIRFEPQDEKKAEDEKKAPAEAALVRVSGPAQGYPGILKHGEQMQISLVFPPHRSAGEYTASLTYTTADAPDVPVKFHTATVEVGMMCKWFAAAIAGIFCVLIILLTFLVSRKGNKALNFFQSPDGSYSVSKVQIWIWTLVIVFAYSYCFLWRDGKLELPVSTWALLGISVASVGIAKTIAVKQDEKKGGSVAPAPPPVAPPAATTALRANWLTSMLSDGGQLSLMRIQMLAWTLVTATIYLVYLFKQQALWDVPAGLLALMGISHTGYLVDKGSAPASDMKCESIQPTSVKEDPTTHMNPQQDLVILGQNFKPDAQCFVGGVSLTLKRIDSNRIEATLPAKSLASGKKYDVAIQQAGEDAEVKAGAFEVTV
jgi:hypothetical protein